MCPIILLIQERKKKMATFGAVFQNMQCELGQKFNFQDFLLNILYTSITTELTSRTLLTLTC